MKKLLFIFDQFYNGLFIFISDIIYLLYLKIKNEERTKDNQEKIESDYIFYDQKTIHGPEINNIKYRIKNNSKSFCFSIFILSLILLSVYVYCNTPECILEIIKLLSK